MATYEKWFGIRLVNSLNLFDIGIDFEWLTFFFF